VASVEATASVADAEAAALFADLAENPALVLAVSGGPDSTALMVLMAGWRAQLRTGPKLLAVTVDHGLRPKSRREAERVGCLASQLGLLHRTVRWRGEKPRTGVQEAARAARYRLLAHAARKFGARHIITAHTLDDQAETVLFRLARGSGIAGLSGMGRISRLPLPPVSGEGDALVLVRPLLGVPKARLIATLRMAEVGFVDDPSNHDPRFARPRLRRSIAILAAEGLDANRLAVFAARARRADAALDWAADEITQRGSRNADNQGGPVAALEDFRRWPAEIALRVLGRAIALTGTEGPAELRKLEALTEAVRTRPAGPPARLRRTLAGAVVTVADGSLWVEAAPPRRQAARYSVPRSL
jgi:tRNA(Ile)-lysidine synthase